MLLQQIGLRHPSIKRVLDIQRNTAPNRRRCFVADGLWAHNVVLDTGTPIEVFLWCPEATYSDEARVRSAQLLARAERAYRISPRTLERISERDRPDGLVSIARMPAWSPDGVHLGGSSLVLVADGIEIPGNLGTLLRTLDACGGSCLLLTNRRTRLTHPKVLRGSRGMSLRVPTIEFDQPDEAIDWLKQRRFTVHLATVGQAAASYRSVDFQGRTAVVVGNERYGISNPWFGHGFPQVAVPMLGAADSLNVSVCASILLYEARARQAGW